VSGLALVELGGLWLRLGLVELGLALGLGAFTPRWYPGASLRYTPLPTQCERPLSVTAFTSYHWHCLAVFLKSSLAKKARLQRYTIDKYAIKYSKTSRVQYISDLHFKFALQPHHVEA